ncbi:hypothetical protein RHSIM_RhsimUnG0121500 [Rhododendron simsii]|uniref:Methyltransferase n=1 Tax=Rhododendron simsii TaxID=118357 RepID=A0A834FVM4_RHOSS|nr:hypothetical protein RHSIM_RhsimUnG0121500 [Rhododendron simsii]
MSNPGAIHLATNLGGKLKREEVIDTIEKYEKYHANYGGDEKERKENYADMVNKYYDLVTSFYEYGWGESFHFASRLKGESLKEGMKRHEHFIALQLCLKPGQKVLDVGCGIGGPLREIAQFSMTSITGLNINEYQITRGKLLDRKAGVDKTCDYVKADFMNMPFPDNSFDAAYAIDATCHAPDVLNFTFNLVVVFSGYQKPPFDIDDVSLKVGCYKEIHRVLKPGQCFAAYEWCMTDSFDPNNREHQSIKSEIELGNGLPDIRTTTQCLEAVKQAGFELMVLECVGLAPKGSRRVQTLLEKSAKGLLDGGRKGIFTADYFFVVRKPRLDSSSYEAAGN